MPVVVFFSGIVLWDRGLNPESQEYSSLFSFDHFKLADTVVLLDSGEKGLSSTEAHSRVWSSPLFATRLAGMQERQEQFVEFIKKKDFKSFGKLLEQEALDIHSVLMTAERPHCYLTEETQDFLVWLRNLREKRSFEAYFTIDAGANVHVLTRKTKQKEFLKYLKSDYQNLKYIADYIGKGPELKVQSLGINSVAPTRKNHEKQPNL